MPSDRLSKRPAHRCANLQPWRVRRPGARIAGSGGCEVHDRCEFDRDYQSHQGSAAGDEEQGRSRPGFNSHDFIAGGSGIKILKCSTSPLNCYIEFLVTEVFVNMLMRESS